MIGYRVAVTNVAWIVGLLILMTARVSAVDWPCFRGAGHDGISTESRFVTRWPESGPEVLWSREVGPAFSSFAIVGDRLYTCGTGDAQQVLFCLGTSDGGVVWQRAFEPQITDPDKHLFGARATPTWNEGRVYVVGGHGLILCCDAGTGEVTWKHQLTNKPNWGYSGSVLIQDDLAIVSGGTSDGALCALNKKTGSIVWKCGDDPAAYATPYPFTFDGKRYICGIMAQSVIVAELETGRRVLRVPWPSHSGVNASSPIFHDGCLFVSTGYGHGSALFKLSRSDDGLLAADEIWRNTKMCNKFQTPVLLDGKLYSSDESGLKCVDFTTGKRHWRKGGIKHGGLTAADGHLILLTEKGELRIAGASAEGFEPLAEAKLFEGTSYSVLQRIARQRQGSRCWTVPVLCGGKLYVRNHDTIVCVDLRPVEK
ncbi:MAG: PQQ-binding-like beta-propeller repeat protein [Planctomycetota bacterium]